ncbi:hypothetical protein IAQ61_005176 [Plenodomus lingam]|nr:hypothetical protein IAQ61_005176 [Plenodomus lingam]
MKNHKQAAIRPFGRDEEMAESTLKLRRDGHPHAYTSDHVMGGRPPRLTSDWKATNIVKQVVQEAGILLNKATRCRALQSAI